MLPILPAKPEGDFRVPNKLQLPPNELARLFMVHVHGAAATGAAEASKHAAQAAHHHAAAGHALMAHAVPAAVSLHHVAKGAAATGAIATASTPASRSFVGRILKHPLVLFGLGVAVGYTVHKYRKEIIESANRAAEKSKDFVLQQRENLEDIVAEGQDPENA